LKSALPSAVEEEREVERHGGGRLQEQLVLGRVSGSSRAESLHVAWNSIPN